jgi:general secretion pathway protein J
VKLGRGFSLIEVMMATALLAAGMALAFAALSNATHATTAAEEESRRAERLRAVQGLLRRQLEGALLLPMQVPRAGEEAPVFEASADHLRLVASMPGYLSRGGPHVQEFRLVRGPRGLRLEFQHHQLTPEGPLEHERPPEVLLDGIRDARFAVRTLEPDGDAGDWLSEWDTVEQLPRLVRLELEFAEPRARWPDFVAAPRLGQSPPPGAGLLSPDGPTPPPEQPGPGR